MFGFNINDPSGNMSMSMGFDSSQSMGTMGVNMNVGMSGPGMSGQSFGVTSSGLGPQQGMGFNVNISSSQQPSFGMSSSIQQPGMSMGMGFGSSQGTVSMGFNTPFGGMNVGMTVPTQPTSSFQQPSFQQPTFQQPPMQKPMHHHHKTTSMGVCPKCEGEGGWGTFGKCKPGL